MTGRWLILAVLASCGPHDDRPCGQIPVCEPGASCFTAPCDVSVRCRHGLEASYYGRAEASDGGCKVAGEAWCASSTVTCAVWGQCAVAPPGFAPAGRCPGADTDRDYLASRHPACAARYGTCIATADAHCRTSQVCALSGRCSARDGVCVATDPADCRASTLCADKGFCSLTGDNRCRSASAADCGPSEACVDRGECGYQSGSCVLCERSADCSEEGRCGLADGRCVALSTAACQRSKACRDDGRCQARHGACVR